MEILLEPTSNKLLVGKKSVLHPHSSKVKFIYSNFQGQITDWGDSREMEEHMMREDQRMNEKIERDAKIARIHAKEELQMMIDGLDRNNETVAKYLQEYYQSTVELPIGERIELISDLVKY
nr:hypothetical protein [Tanacetum cinerariifolium]